jgi:hypothetical protein
MLDEKNGWMRTEKVAKSFGQFLEIGTSRKRLNLNAAIRD